MKVSSIDAIREYQKQFLVTESQYQLQIPRDSEGKKKTKRKKNKPLYHTQEIWINSDTYINQYLKLKPCTRRVWGILKKWQKNNTPFRLDNRLIASCFKPRMSIRNVNYAMEELDKHGIIYRSDIKEFKELKDEFELREVIKSRLIQIILPLHVRVVNSSINSMERNGKSMVAEFFGVDLNEVTFEMVANYIFNYSRLDIPQVSHGVQIYSYHICYGMQYHNLNNIKLSSKGNVSNLSLKDFPLTTKSNILNRKDSLNLNSVQDSSSKIFEKIQKIGTKKRGNSFLKASESDEVRSFGVSQIVSDDTMPKPWHFESDESFVDWLNETFKIPRSHGWVFVSICKSVVLLGSLIDDPIVEMRNRFTKVTVGGELLSSVIGYSDNQIRYIESKFFRGGKFGSLPEKNLHDEDDTITCEEEGEVGNAKKYRPSADRMNRMGKAEEKTLANVTSRRQQAEEQRAIKKFKDAKEREFSSVDAVKRAEKTKASKLVNIFFENWDFDLDGSGNLTARGSYMKFILEISQKAEAEKWHKSWKWLTVRAYYHFIRKHQMGQVFKSDIFVYSKKDTHLINSIGNIKKAMDKFNFVEYMEVLYYLLNDPEDVYAYGFFASDFKLVKMTKYDRILKVQSIMNNRGYWDDTKLFIESESEIRNSANYQEEERAQSLAQLNDIGRAEFLRLEVDIKNGDSEYLRLDALVDNLKDRLEVLKDFLASYDINLGRFEPSVAIDFTYEMFELKGCLIPKGITNVEIESKDLIKQIKEKSEELKKCSDLETKKQRLQELKNDN